MAGTGAFEFACSNCRAEHDTLNIDVDMKVDVFWRYRVYVTWFQNTHCVNERIDRPKRGGAVENILPICVFAHVAGNSLYARHGAHFLQRNFVDANRPGDATDQPAEEPVHRALGLTDDELDSIRDILGREPNHLELAMYAVMWSEHCSYKSSKVHLRRFPTDFQTSSRRRIQGEAG